MDLRNLAQYNLWAGNHIREILSKLSEEEFTKNLGEIIGSTRAKVEHIIFALETGFAFLRNDWKNHQKTIEHIKSLDIKIY
ncbi:MAG: DinB family protein [Candidatus Hodarchaeales archaeon]|jgi:uncharacterized damage-inducible protein DinB